MVRNSDNERTDEPGLRPDVRLELYLALALVVVTLLVYCPVLDCKFINMDDPTYVVRNRHVEAGLTRSGIGWAFRTFDCGNWHPLTWLSLQLDSTLYGGLKPAGFHFTNLVLHLANVVLLFHVFALLTGAIWQSAFIAGLFALHPLHVESVAWVAERKDVLSTSFWMLTLWAYALYAERPGWRSYSLVLLAFALGLLAKPMVVTLPFVLLLLDYWPLGRLRLRARLCAPDTPSFPHETTPRLLLLEKLPLLALALVSCVITVKAQALAEAIASIDAYPLGSRLLNAQHSYAAYLFKMIWPTNLEVLYPLLDESVLRNDGLAAGIFVLVVTVGVLLARSKPYLLVGWFWYLGTLVPVIGLVQVGNQSMADRYTYIPLIGIFLALTWSCADVVEAVGRRGFLIAQAGAALLVLIACACVTWNQLATWRDSSTLWEHAIQVDPVDPVSHARLAADYLEKGFAQQALRRYERTAELRRDSPGYQYDVGLVLLMTGDTQRALRVFTEVERLKPDWANLHHKLALVHVVSPESNLPEASRHARLALDSGTVHAEVLALYAYIEHQLGHADVAAQEYRRSLALDPNWPERANDQASQVLAGKPPSAHQIRLALYLARECCQAVNDRRIDFLQTLAAAERFAGHRPEAVEALRKASTLAAEKGDTELKLAIEKQLERDEEPRTK